MVNFMQDAEYVAKFHPAHDAIAPNDRNLADAITATPGTIQKLDIESPTAGLQVLEEHQGPPVKKLEAALGIAERKMEIATYREIK